MRVGRGGKEPSVCKQQCSFVPQNTSVNYQLKYPVQTGPKKRGFANCTRNVRVIMNIVIER